MEHFYRVRDPELSSAAIHTSWQNPQNAVTRSDGNQDGNKLLPGTPTSQMHCVIAERNAPCDLAQAASAIHRPHSVLHALHRHSGSTPFQRPQAHPARRDPRRHNEQKLTVPDPQAAGMRHRPNFGKRKQLMATIGHETLHPRAIVTCASHHMRFTHITCPSSICADA